jgi:DnaJ-class molecular chaperone
MHPDTMENPTEQDNTNFQNLNEAYKTLKDPVLRKMYDMNLKNGIHGRPDHNPNFSDMDSNRKFYENRWYNGKVPKDDLRYNNDFNDEFNEFLRGEPSKIPFLRRFVSEETYDRITSFRYKFLMMITLVLFFEWIYMKAKKTEDKRLELLHELEEKKNPEYSMVIQEYIEGRATNNNFIIE